MIQIILSDITFENDVYSLVKAFYPGETIKVSGEDENKENSSVNIEYNNSSNNRELKTLENELPTIETQPSVEGRSSWKILSSVEAIRFMNISFSAEKISVLITFETGKELLKSLELDASVKTKTKYKNIMKRFLYHLLSEVSHRELPWGILTGIRPTKLVFDMLEKGLDDDSIRTSMREEYLCSNEKTTMSIRIAKRELELLREIDYQNGYSLYIGIPFCPSTCLYCSFTSYSISKFSAYVEEYLNTLEKEIKYGATCFPDKKLTTVYFGGGTPTTLTAEQLDRLLGSVKKHFDFTYVKEFCVEAGRPDSITREKLLILKKWGVDRISINPQSMQQKTLDIIGRKHTIEQTIEAFQLARETGHENINMDIIIGLPGENTRDVTSTLAQIKALNPESLTVHTLALKRAARLNLEKENYIELKATDVPAMLEATIQFAEENDYLPYYLYRQKNMADNLENIGYSKFGKEGLYNILIMEEQQTILALGAGGMSKFVFHEEHRIERVDNVKSVTDYISRIDEMIQRKQDFIRDNRSKRAEGK